MCVYTVHKQYGKENNNEKHHNTINHIPTVQNTAIFTGYSKTWLIQKSIIQILA
jgi:hypothetical protein